MLHILSSDIGRGHPYFLDGVREELAAMGASHAVDADASVFEIAKEPSHTVWRAARRAYLRAGHGGSFAKAYGALRSTKAASTGAILPRLLGHGLTQWARPARVVLVDHPLLVAALHQHHGCWYQHGELVAPAPSITRGAARVFVPSKAVADAFVRGGVPSGRIVVTGLCVDGALGREVHAHRSARRARLAGNGPLVLALYSSGAEPDAHVASLAAAAASLARAGHEPVVFAKRGRSLQRAVEAALAQIPAADRARVEIVPFDRRRDLTLATRSRFGRFDAYVGPPHERSSWALGLGLPALFVGPDIGPFAPANRALMIGAGVAAALPFDEATRLGARNGTDLHRRLLGMCESAPELPLDGFREIARHVVEARNGAAVAG
jgi:hypothetical protein